mmetsp:Transcript_53632/g.123328  ORF Transcript_53632/g.123328 Transcript_53632/m.123328 type:complete len:267 (-) Transcript_53632:10-810(-)
MNMLPTHPPFASLPAEEKARDGLVNHWPTPQRLLHRKSGDGEHREPAVVDLVGALVEGHLVFQPKRIETKVARHVLFGGRAEVGLVDVIHGLQLKEARDAEHEEHEGRVRPEAVCEHGGATVGEGKRTEWEARLEHLGERPADDGEHGEARVLELCSTHVVQSQLDLLGGTLFHDAFPLLDGPREGAYPVENRTLAAVIDRCLFHSRRHGQGGEVERITACVCRKGAIEVRRGHRSRLPRRFAHRDDGRARNTQHDGGIEERQHRE